MEIRIEQDKTKPYTFLAFVGLLTVVLIAALATALRDVAANAIPIAILSLTILSCAYLLTRSVRKLNDKSPGLLFTSEGFQFNASPHGKAIGFVKWSDIKCFKGLGKLGKDGKFTIDEYAEQSYITVVVSNPEYYVGRMKSGFIHRQVEKRACEEGTGEILFLSSHNLDCKLSELRKHLSKVYEHYLAQQAAVV